MNLFYLADPQNDICILDKEESMHCVKVMRMKQGSEIFLTDGNGFLFKAILLNPDPKGCVVQIIERTKSQHDSGAFLHIAVAPTKNMARFEWFLEKATEIGVHEITPVFCKHSERSIIKTDRLHKIIISAAKQSLKTRFPKLSEPITFNDLMKISFLGQKFIAYCNGNERRGLHQSYRKNENMLILIGPEGDFDNTETALALESGFEAIILGENRLRTETAALYACCAFHFLNE